MKTRRIIFTAAAIAWMHTDPLTAEKYVRRRDKVKEINDKYCAKEVR